MAIMTMTMMMMPIMMRMRMTMASRGSKTMDNVGAVKRPIHQHHEGFKKVAENIFDRNRRGIHFSSTH